jgi:dCMP deaminase
MELAKQSAKIFSTCGKRQYAAILVNDQNHIVGFGYNGGPSKFTHCKDGGCPRLQEDSPSGSNYDNCISIHAEQNAFLNSDYSSEPTRLYVNGPPCFTCAKMIANSSVKNVYYLSDPNYSQFIKVQEYLHNAGVNLVEIPPGTPNIKTIIR